MKRNHYQAFVLFGMAFLWSATASAQLEVDTVIQNVSNSVTSLPGLLAALCYLAALLTITWALFKTMDHVKNPSQVPFRSAAVRYLVGGGLFALPILTEAAIRTINGGAFGGGVDPLDDVNTVFAVLTLPFTLPVALNLNVFMGNMLSSVDFIPGMVAIVGYLLALLLTVSATFKVREHVDDPDRVGLREPVTRYLAAGALFALPTIFEAMYTTIAGGGMGLWAGLNIVALNALSFLYASDSTFGGLPACSVIAGNPISLATVICLFMISTSFIPIFLSAISYFLGLVFGVWGVMKIRDHVLNPSQTRLNEGIMRFIAGGAFFAMPYIATVLQSSVTSTPLSALMLGATVAGTNTGFSGTANVATCTAAALLGANSLDMALSCFMINVLGPSQTLLNFFCFVAGLVLTMIGISRLVRSSQEGVKGPGGRGTVATFIAAGILMSANTIIRAFSSSFFALPVTLTSANLAYTGGMSPAEIAAAQNVMSAVLRFMIIVGLISFVRGIFIVREVADGGQQASLMSGITHIIGGAFAVNLGPLLNFVQGTLGITTFGATFT